MTVGMYNIFLTPEELHSIGNSRNKETYLRRPKPAQLLGNLRLLKWRQQKVAKLRKYTKNGKLSVILEQKTNWE